MPVKVIMSWVSKFAHCKQSWELYAPEVGPDECPMCGTWVDPVWYIEEPDFDYDNMRWYY